MSLGPCTFRIVGKTDSTNLRMHWHRGELIFNWEVSVRELRVHDPATAEQLEGSVDATLDAASARDWLTHKQTGLGNTVPLEFAKTEIGAREVENLLGRIEYGVYS